MLTNHKLFIIEVVEIIVHRVNGSQNSWFKIFEYSKLITIYNYMLDSESSIQCSSWRIFE